MKDFLTQTIKLEEKIRRGNLLKSYYSGMITWGQFVAESDKLKSTVKALTEEAAVKTTFRNELEKEMYPLDYWMNKNTH